MFFPFDENFDSASFRDELADALGLPVDRVRITTNTDNGISRFLRVAIIDLTQAQETEVSAFFDDNPTFILGGFGTVTTNDSFEVGKPNGIVTIGINNVCTSVPVAGFPATEYEEAFDNALGGTVTTSIDLINGDSPDCDDATPPGSTLVITDIEVPAADLGAVLALLPTASSTIDLGGDFGVVSLGNDVFLFT